MHVTVLNSILHRLLIIPKTNKQTHLHSQKVIMLSKPISSTNMGRRKIELKRISDEAARQVTFSKRRAGLFKKASELCIMCGAETAIIVFSPAGKPYSFAHPSIEAVTDRFLNELNSSTSASKINIDVAAINGELKREYEDAVEALEGEKKRGETLRELVRLNVQIIEVLDLGELEKLWGLMEELKRGVEASMGRSCSPASSLEVDAIGVVDPFGNNTSDVRGFGSQRRLFSTV